MPTTDSVPEEPRDIGFTIGEPGAELPIASRSKYAAVWERAAALRDGEMLPVTFETPRQAQSFQTGYSGSAEKMGLRIRIRGTTAYIMRRGRFAKAEGVRDDE